MQKKHHGLISFRPLVPGFFAAAVVAGAWLGAIGAARAEAPQPTTTANPAEVAAPAELKALLVTGGCCHDYPNQTTILCESLEERVGPIEWTVVNYGSKREALLEIYKEVGWAKPFDFVVHNECYGGVDDPAVIDRIVDGHIQSGVPAIAIHCSMHSYRGAKNADRWRALLGVTSTFHEKKKRSLTVVPTQADHPVMREFPSPWKTPNGELYIIRKTWPGTEVLATAYSDEQEADQPVIWTNQHEGVKLVGISLGHHNETMSSPVYLQLTAEAVRWVLSDEASK